MKCIAEGGVFSIYEHQHDLSVDSNTAMNSYFMEQMNVKKRQVLCKLDNSTVKLQAGTILMDKQAMLKWIQVYQVLKTFSVNW